MHSRPSRSRRIGGVVAALLLAMVAIGYGYGFAGWAIAKLPANRDWRQSDAGAAIYVEDNGIHTGIVLPKAVLPPGLLARLRAGDLRDPDYTRHDHVAFGWGDRAFYIETPTWRDLDAATVAHAATGSDDTVMHVEHIARPVAREGVRMARLRPEELAGLIAFIEGSFDPAGPPPEPGYGPHDAFYSATGRYSAIVTCNEWTGRALRHAGVTIGVWTPFSQGVMQWLEPLPMD